LHGLLYLALVPPWQHYDEPTHFEYVRLVALLNRQPEAGDVDRETNRTIADSMYRFGFWSPGVRPDLLGPQGPSIGITQFVHPPLYYTLVAVPVRWLHYLSVETQLYATRIVALGLYLLIIVVAWRVCTLLLPDDYLSQVIVPLLIIVTPAFSDMMSATNNDVLVNFSITTLLLGCILLVRNGVQPVPLLLALLSLSVALLTKRTAVVGIVPFTLALFWALHQRPVRWWLYGVVLVGCILGALLVSVRLTAVGASSSGPYTLVLRSWLVQLDQYYLRLSLERLLSSLLDWERTRDLYPSVGRVLFASFWMRFGWGHVKIGTVWEYGMLGLVMLGGMGLLLQGIRRRSQLSLWQQRCIWLFITTLLAAWFAALLRIHPLPSPEATGVYVPVGRYIHLAILPTIWLLVWGIQGVVCQRWRAYSVWILVLFFIFIDTTAWAYTLVNFYYRW
jgi:4-amino-4-deoxy-L-arabinose transferase-like glycosyltransferase